MQDTPHPAPHKPAGMCICAAVPSCTAAVCGIVTSAPEAHGVVIGWGKDVSHMSCGTPLALPCTPAAQCHQRING
jgi:hypothetical protein